jgi:hypothetical protein
MPGLTLARICAAVMGRRAVSRRAVGPFPSLSVMSFFVLALPPA